MHWIQSLAWYMRTVRNSKRRMAIVWREEVGWSSAATPSWVLIPRGNSFRRGAELWLLRTAVIIGNSQSCIFFLKKTYKSITKIGRDPVKSSYNQTVQPEETAMHWYLKIMSFTWNSLHSLRGRAKPWCVKKISLVELWIAKMSAQRREWFFTCCIHWWIFKAQNHAWYGVEIKQISTNISYLEHLYLPGKYLFTLSQVPQYGPLSLWALCIDSIFIFTAKSCLVKFSH
jgi:hypothetical protein